MIRTLLLCSVLTTSTLFSAPSLKREHTFTQPDGTTFQGQLKGDEYLHWIESDQGDLLIYNRGKKQFEKATVGSDALLGSGRAYHPASGSTLQRSPQETMQRQNALKKLWLKRKEQWKLHHESAEER